MKIIDDALSVLFFCALGMLLFIGCVIGFGIMLIIPIAFVIVIISLEVFFYNLWKSKKKFKTLYFALFVILIPVSLTICILAMFSIKDIVISFIQAIIGLVQSIF